MLKQVFCNLLNLLKQVLNFLNRFNLLKNVFFNWFILFKASTYNLIKIRFYLLKPVLPIINKF